MAKAKKKEKTVEVVVDTKVTKSKKAVETKSEAVIDVETSKATKKASKKKVADTVVELGESAVIEVVASPVVESSSSKSEKKKSKKEKVEEVESDLELSDEDSSKNKKSKKKKDLEVEHLTPSKSKSKKAASIVDDDDDDDIDDDDAEEDDFIDEKPHETEDSEFIEDEVVDLVETDVVAVPPIEEIAEEFIDGKKRKRRSKKNSESDFEPFNEPIKIEGKAFKLNKGEQVIQVPSKKDPSKALDAVPFEPVLEPTSTRPIPKSHKKGKKEEPQKKDHKYLAQAAEIKANLRNQENRPEMPRPENKKVEIVPKAPAPDVRYSDEDLQMFQDVITSAKNESIEELRMLRERLDDLTSSENADELMIYSMHMAEQGSEAIEKEKTYAQVQRISEYLKKLDDALDRIKAKTYGICRICGCLIAKERLLAVPITTLSASYKIQEKCPEDNIDRIEPLRNKVSANN